MSDPLLVVLSSAGTVRVDRGHFAGPGYPVNIGGAADMS